MYVYSHFTHKMAEDILTNVGRYYMVTSSLHLHSFWRSNVESHRVIITVKFQLWAWCG